MPTTEPQNRAEAVAYLTAQGFDAFERDWILGKTVGVAAEPFEHHGIKGWRRMIYIVPTNGGWELECLNTHREAPVIAETLAHACELALAALRDPTW